MSWTERPLLAVDTETTGVDCWADRIVEVAAVVVNPDGSTGAAFCVVVDPGVEIPTEASDVHGITTERARAEGVSPFAALNGLARAIVAAPAFAPLAIYNARFDVPLLIAEAERHGVELPLGRPIIDPLVIDKALDRYRKGGRKQVTVAEHYGVELGDAAHGALADATATGRIAFAIAQRYPEVATRSLAGLWADQVAWQEDQRDSFVDYMRRNRDPNFQSPVGWPIPVRPRVLDREVAA